MELRPLDSRLASGFDTDMEARDMDDVLEKLADVIAGYRSRRSPLAFFPAVYRATSARVREGIRAGTFEDGARMDRFATTFANRYFAALDAVATGTPPTRVWQVVFESEGRARTMILQHVLLGMNAHINFDLPLTVLSLAGGGPIAPIESDFNAINDILASLLDPVQEVIDRFSPLLGLLDWIGGTEDEHLVRFSIKQARRGAWRAALRLSGQSDAERARSIAVRDDRVAAVAKEVIVPGGFLGLATKLIASTESSNREAVTDALRAIQ